MRQWKLFLFRSLIGLWIVLFSSFLSLIIFETRSINVNRPIVEVSLEATDSVNEVAIPGRIFTCKEVDSQDQCQAAIQGRPLVLTLTPEESNGFASSCKATYDGQRVGCHNNDFGLGAMIQRAFQIRDIGLDTQQLKAVRRRYWGLNTLLDIGEVRLMEIGTGLAISFSTLVAGFVWVRTKPLNPAKEAYMLRIVSLVASGLGIGFVSYWSFLLLLLSTGFAD
ncbi:hypothetical protein PN498_02235 [Oscillatoria sp. CS-180]|uniref:hypothetical protein n=1 Tax=Oscillatoria sp. CS-180 TaxID=3021720 RepID=UPI00232EEFE9|nr:hypothetical protein [Oscillatoria sp. CS-180]MDB9524793.1 hypothetical protein [Oscillatoria sp. CS-180]